MLEPVLITPLAIISGEDGDVRHGVKLGALGYSGFGEAYFSTVKSGKVKGWKRHTRMTLNLIPVVGIIQVSTYNQETGSGVSVLMSADRMARYVRVTVPPFHWVAFGGLESESNILLNVADFPHDPAETESAPLSAFSWKWTKQNE